MHIKICSKCRNQIPADALFCSRCGNSFAPAYKVPTAEDQKRWNKQLLILMAVLVPLGLIFTAFAAFVTPENNKPKSVAFVSPSPSSPIAVQPAPQAQAVSLNTVQQQTIEGKVVGVHDGDTCTVLDANKKQWKIRFAGIDAPELAQDFGQKAKQNLSNLIFGKVVRVLTGKTDKYGRTVGVVFVGDQDINLQQVTDGFAWHYKEYESEQSPEDRKTYAAAELTARDKDTGLWAQENLIAPWAFRHGDAVSPEDAKKIFGNSNSKIYHWAGCPGFTKIGTTNKVVFNSIDEAEAAGYRAAKNCTKPKPSGSGSTLVENAEDGEAEISTPAPRADYSTGTRSVASSGSREYITGPRGGCYYINGNGNKTYVERELCGSQSVVSAPARKVYSAPVESSSGSYTRGPRGGCYTISASGRKRYVDRSLCN